MSKNGLIFVLLFFGFLFLQVGLLNQIALLGYATPFLYIYFILKLPTSLSSNWVITLGFALGLAVDIFSNTLGINALATVLTAACRNPLLNRIQHRDELPNGIPGVRTLGPVPFFRYAVLLIVLHNLLIFTVEAFSLFHILTLLLKIVSSSLLTLVLVVSIEGTRPERR